MYLLSFPISLIWQFIPSVARAVCTLIIKFVAIPVLEGVLAILGRMVLTSNPETKAAFEEIPPTRLDN